MFRYFGLTTLGLVAAAILNAGQIQVGASSGAAGLTAGYVSGAAGCAGTYAPNSAGFTSCLTTGLGAGGTLLTGSTSFGTTGKSFSGALFNGATGITGPSTPITANGVTFDLFTNSSSALSQWAGSGGTSDGNTYTPGTNTAGSATLTVAIGVFDVAEAWTLLSDYWGVSGAQNTSVTFNFGNSSNIANGDSVTDVLTNGNQIADTFQCLTPTNCNPYGYAQSAPGAVTAFSSNYSGDASVGSPYMGTTGTVNLYEQAFDLTGGNRANEWLVDMVITNTGGTGVSNSNGPDFGLTSRTSLAAITLNAAPEPSTILLFATGLGALGLTRLRRRKRA